jgi:MFS family permease
MSSRPFAPWYLAYLILGLQTSGMLPFLMPLVVLNVSHQLGTVAYVTGAYNLGLLPAPLFGRLAERRQLYRTLFFGGFIVLGVAFLAFPHVTNAVSWVLLALLIGLSTGAAATVSTLFVVDFAPKVEWETRIGWLQSFNGAGQLLGLLLAGAFAQGHFTIAFTLAGGLAAVALVIGRFGLPLDERTRARVNPVGQIPLQQLLRPVQVGPGLGGLLPHSHHLQWAALSALPHALSGRFGRFLLAWAVYNFGVAAFFAYYPLMMRHSFGIPPQVTADTYAVAAGIGVALFVVTSRLSARHGAGAVFRGGRVAAAGRIRATGGAVPGNLSAARFGPDHAGGVSAGDIGMACYQRVQHRARRPSHTDQRRGGDRPVEREWGVGYGRRDLCRRSNGPSVRLR